MIRRAVFLADGSSDEPLSEHLEQLCAVRGVEVRITTPNLGRLPNPPGRKVADRLRAVLDLGSAPDIVFVHRDAEKQNPCRRHREIARAVALMDSSLPFIAVVPVRMTEAWLLVDEQRIRDVAGRSSSSISLGLPALLQIEDHPNPKALLKNALDAASGLQGRRLRQFQRRFGENRRNLLQGLDVYGPVRRLSAWQALESSLDKTLTAL